MSEPTATLAELEKDLRRVTDRLRTAPVARVAAEAAAARVLLQVLADAAAGVEARAATAPPRWREVPVLPDSALGDQLEVLGRDVVVALREAGDLPCEAGVWTRAGSRPVGEVVDDLAARLRGLRAAL